MKNLTSRFFRVAVLTVLVLILSQGQSYSKARKSFVGQYPSYQSKDEAFSGAFIDEDRIISSPIRCRLIHGGFSNGTRFCAYFPEKDAFEGRFFQYITPTPDDERVSFGFEVEINPIVFSIKHGAYFLSTNQGGQLDMSDESTRVEPTIGAYRASAACADFTRYIATQMYDCPRPRGYCYGGSGGAYRTAGGAEATDTWEGAVPYVMGSTQALPNVFTIRMWALRVLGEKLDDVVDAMREGGSKDPYATLDLEQRQVLAEATKMGFPIKAWYPWRSMDPHGYRTLHRMVRMTDPEYFEHDFWENEGYEGYSPSPSLKRDRIQLKTRIKRIVRSQEVKDLPFLSSDESGRGTADRAWAYAGSYSDNRPVAVELEQIPESIGMGADLVTLSGSNPSHRYQLSAVYENYAIFETVNSKEDLALLSEGDSVMVDNSDFLAVEAYHRHQMPSEDFHVWDQFRGVGGAPIYPQRPVLLGPIISQLATGIPYDGDIKCKVIVCCSVWDREAFAWQGDWYRQRVEAHLGEKTDDNFRLWYTDRATHGEEEPSESVPYMTTVYQALLDLDDWVTKGIEPSKTTSYRIEDGQVVLDENGITRGGLQPSIKVTAEGKERADVKIGERTTLDVVIDIPEGTGSLALLEWSEKGDGTFEPLEDPENMTIEGNHITFRKSVSYDSPGTFFPSIRVSSERNGDPDSIFTLIKNLGKCRVVVE